MLPLLRQIRWQLVTSPLLQFLKPISMSSLVIIMLLGWCASASGQISGRATMQGTVTDPSGAIIPGAQVKLVEVRTNQANEQASTDAGFYSFGGLQPGIYSVTVTAPGFQTYTQENIPLNALQTFGLNVKMRVGGRDTTVTVTDTPAPLNTTNATLGSTMETDTYKALPLLMGGQPRDPTAFIYFTPGVTGGGGVNQMNGGQSNLNETYIDGVAMDDISQQSDWAPVHSTFSVDAVDQFQVQTSGVSAAYQGQGMQNYVHKSGTNAFHGSAFEYFRNTALDTWGFYGPANIPAGTTKAIKTAEHQNEFGGTFGGHVPYFKDKIFFFVSYDNDHYIHGNYGFINVATTRERNGDFSELLTAVDANGKPAPQAIYDPASSAACAAHNIGGAACRYQFGYGPGPGIGRNGNAVLIGTPNVIPASRLSPISQYMQKFLPAPTNGNLTLNYFGGFNTGFNYPRQSYKLDFDVIRNHSISLLFLEGGRYPNPVCCDGSGLPRPYLTTVGNTQNNLTAMISDTWTINQRTVNKLNYAFSVGGFHGVGNTNPGAGNPDWYPAAAGITNVPPGQASESFPSTSFAGPNSPLGWTTNDQASHGDAIVFHLQDGLQLLKGRHSLSVGGEYQWEDGNSVGLNTGTYLRLSYSNNETACFGSTKDPTPCQGGGSLNTTQGAAYASYLLGATDSVSVTDNRPALEINARYHNFSPYVQDDIKVSPRLTVNVGLRWDVYSPWTEKRNRFSFVNLNLLNPVTGTPGALQFGGNGTSPTYCNCSRVVDTWYKNFGPRLGFAYAIDTRTVMRGSYGIYYSHAGGVGGRAGAIAGTGQLGFNGGASFGSPNGGITPGLYLDSSNNAIPSYPLPPFIDPGNGTGFTTNATYASTTPNGVTYADPYLSRRAPYYQNFNFGFQRELFNQTILNLDYSGSIGHFLGTGIGRGIYSNQLDPRYYVLGPSGLLTKQATAANVLLAQAILPSFKLPFANYSTSATIGQALRPFPQYGGFGDIWGDVGNSNYHSLQLQLKQNFRHGLNYALSYTWSKGMDDTGGSRSAYGVNGVPSSNLEYGLSGTDIPNHVTFYAVYNEGFGKSGGYWLSNELIKDWAVSGTFRYQSGTPITITSTGCNTPFAGTCYPNLVPGVNPRINGGYGRMNTATINQAYLNPAAFQTPAPYTFGNAPRSYAFGLRNPGGYNEDLSLRRSFGIHERLKFTFEGSLFNVDNHTDFGGPNTAFGSSTFGIVSNQSNGSRTAQFSGRFDF